MCRSEIGKFSTTSSIHLNAHTNVPYDAGSVKKAKSSDKGSEKSSSGALAAPLSPMLSQLNRPGQPPIPPETYARYKSLLTQKRDLKKELKLFDDQVTSLATLLAHITPLL